MNAEWWSVVVGAVQDVALIVTLRYIYVQARGATEAANATKDSADAALLNAKALINAERPWLVVTWISDKKSPGLFRFSCRNQGNTPAKVTSISANLCFIDLPDNLPVPASYPPTGTLPDLNFIVHADSFTIEKGLNPESYTATKAKTAVVHDAKEFLVYYGSVTYRDVLYPESAPEGKHETHWCFIYRPNETKSFVRSGPREYNHET